MPVSGWPWVVGGEEVTDGIAVGMVFERHGAPHLRWAVEEITRIGAIPHVYLQRIGDPTDVRLLSLSALADEREFHRVEASSSVRALKHAALCRILGP